LFKKYAKQDKRIKLFKTPKNYGNPGGPGQLAIKKSKYILPIDQDDIAVKDILKESIIFMENNPNIDICGGWQQFFGDSKRISKSVEQDEDIKARLLNGCPFGHSTRFCRKVPTNLLSYLSNLNFR
jgi:GT2 family glycosyltransferase